MAGVHYRLDDSWRRLGATVLAGSPLRAFRLTAQGEAVADSLQNGVAPPDDATIRLVDRLVDAGALHPLPTPDSSMLDEATIVVPAYNRVPVWIVAAATALDGRVILVDDCSSTPLTAPAGVTVVRHDRNRGPSAARNSGLALVETEYVVFIDTDVSFPDERPFGDWLTTLLAHFTDERVALVAPRVASAPGDGWLAKYDQRHSPLDLGAHPARIAIGTRVAYVPAAVIACRTSAINELGGFDDNLLVGEDVDLVWRLNAADHRCRFEPSVVALHDPRPSVRALLCQRFGYGASAAPLSVRHPGAVTPLRVGWAAALVVALGLVRRPLLAVAATAAAVFRLQRKLKDLPLIESVRLVGMGLIATTRQLADALCRVWWPLAIVLAVTRRRSRVPLLVMAALPSIELAAEQRNPRLLLDTPMHVIERAAYGAGVWKGVVATGDFGAVLPEFRSSTP